MSKADIPRKHHDRERAEARRNQVLDAAMTCFTHHGFHGASMAEIAREAGMSIGHIYNYFASKEEIIFGIVDRHMEDVLLRIQSLVGPDRDVMDSLMDGAHEAVSKNTTDDYAALLLEVTAEAARNPAVATKLHATDRLLLARLDEQLMTSTQLSTYQKDPARAGRLNMLIVLFEGLRLRSRSNPALDPDMLIEPLRRAIRAILAD